MDSEQASTEHGAPGRWPISAALREGLQEDGRHQQHYGFETDEGSSRVMTEPATDNKNLYFSN